MGKNKIFKRVIGYLILLVIIFLIIIKLIPSSGRTATARTKEELMKEITKSIMNQEEKLTLNTTVNPSFITYEVLVDEASKENKYMAVNLSGFEYKCENGKMEIELEYSMSNFEIKMFDKFADQLAEELDGLSDYEKIKYAHDYIILHGEYQYFEPSPYHLVFKGGGKCTSYSNAFLRVMEKMGIECNYAMDSEHQWNIVKLNGEWYNIDLTWDDAEDDKISYEYFLKNNDEFKKHGTLLATAKESYPQKDMDKRYDFPLLLPDWYRICEIGIPVLLLVILVLLILLAKHKRNKNKRTIYYKQDDLYQQPIPTKTDYHD